MATRINIDPITRIEGHLRIDAEVENGTVSKAWASCTMWRGIENIVLGGLGYRFDPTTFAYRHWSRTYYTPAVIEILISLGFICFCVICFLWAVKRLPILPAPVEQWYESENYYRKIYPYIQLSGYGDTNQYRPHYAD